MGLCRACSAALSSRDAARAISARWLWGLGRLGRRGAQAPELTASDKLVCKGSAQPEGSSGRDNIDYGRQHQHLFPGQSCSPSVPDLGRTGGCPASGPLDASTPAVVSSPERTGRPRADPILGHFRSLRVRPPARRSSPVARRGNAGWTHPSGYLPQQAAGDQRCLCAGESAGRVELQTGALGDNHQARPAADDLLVIRGV